MLAGACEYENSSPVMHNNISSIVITIIWGICQAIFTTFGRINWTKFSLKNLFTKFKINFYRWIFRIIIEQIQHKCRSHSNFKLILPLANWIIHYRTIVKNNFIIFWSTEEARLDIDEIPICNYCRRKFL